MIIVGLILVLLALLPLGLPGWLLWIGLVLLIVGCVLALIGRTHPVGGRRWYW
jgi:hypothetical protein